LKPADRKLLARLVQIGVLTPVDVERVVAVAEAPGARALPLLLVEDGFVPSREIARAQADLGGFTFVNVLSVQPESNALAMLDASTASRRYTLPLKYDGTRLTVAMADPGDVYTCDAISLKVRVPLETLYADRDEIREAIRMHYGTVDDTAGRLSAEDVAIAKFEAQREIAASSESVRRISSASIPTPDRSQFDTPPEVLPIRQEALEPAKSELLDALERSRAAMDPSPVIPTAEIELDAKNPVTTLLRSLIEDSYHGGAEVLQFTPMIQSIRVRARFAEGWRELTPYPSKYHEEITKKLHRLAGWSNGRPEGSAQRVFVLPVRKVEHTCVAQFDATPSGESVSIYFPDNVPLLADPLRNIGLTGETGDALERRLVQQGGGLLLVSTPGARTASRLHGSMLRRYSGAGREVVSFERASERVVAGATQINTPTTDLLLAALTNCSYMAPDLVFVGSIENGTVLAALLKLAMRGTTCVGFLAAHNAQSVLVSLRAAGADPSMIVRGVAGLLHVMEARLLCTACRRVCDTATQSSIPEWAMGMNVPFHEAPGCDACAHTGRTGTTWVSELLVPDANATDGSFQRVVSRVALLDELARAGRIDPRDFP